MVGFPTRGVGSFLFDEIRLFQFWRIAAVRNLIFTDIGFWLLVSTGLASPVTLWRIGEDEDPFASGYQPTDEFSQESGNSNVGPGLVTRLPGDPLYNSGSNPTATIISRRLVPIRRASTASPRPWWCQIPNPHRHSSGHSATMIRTRAFAWLG
jgi:hypothetical protein